MGSGKELGRREWGNVPRNRGNWGMAEWWKGTEGGDLGERKVPKGGTPGRERDRTRGQNKEGARSIRRHLG